MFRFGELTRQGPMAALAALALTACATGQGSFVAGSGGSADSAVEEAFFDEAGADDATPGLLAASGNALLPGGRTLGARNVAPVGNSTNGRPLLSTGAVAASVDANVNLLNGSTASLGLTSSLASAQTSLSLGGPLLALNGSRSALLGVGVTGPTALGVTPNVAVNLGGAVNPATAASQTLISATVGVLTPATPVSPTTGAPAPSTPLLPPILGVPGTTPLQTLLPRLPTAPKPLPGLLGN